MSTASRIFAALLLACASMAQATTHQICIKDVNPGSDWNLQYTVAADSRVKVEWFFEPSLANMGIQGKDLFNPSQQGIFTYALDQLNGTVFEGKLILINTLNSIKKVVLYDPLAPQQSQTPIQFDWEDFSPACKV